MASLRAQILDAVEAKLVAVAAEIDWATVLRNPREVVGDDQYNALLQMDGGDREPGSLTGHVETRWLEFSVGMMVRETGGDGPSAEELLDAGYVAVSDALLDPDDMQLGGLAVAIAMGAVSDPLIGRGQTGAAMIGGQVIDFSVQYWTREGDASSAAP